MARLPIDFLVRGVWSCRAGSNGSLIKPWSTVEAVDWGAFMLDTDDTERNVNHRMPKQSRLRHCQKFLTPQIVRRLGAQNSGTGGTHFRFVGRHPPQHLSIFGQPFRTAPNELAVAQSRKWPGWKFLLQT
jgi:hypothetical protein